MATNTTLGFSIVSRYFGAGTKRARRDINQLNDDLVRHSRVSREAAGGMNLFARAATLVGPALTPISGVLAGVSAGTLALGAAAGTAFGAYGLAVLGAVNAAIKLDKKHKAMLPAQRMFITNFHLMKKAIAGVSTGTLNLTLKTATVIVQGLTAGIKHMTPVIKAVHPIILKMAIAFRNWMAGRGLSRFIGVVIRQGIPAMKALLAAGRNMLTVLGIGFRTFAPLGVDIARALERGSVAMKRWAQGGGFARFLSSTRANAPIVKAFFKAIAQLLLNLSIALAAVGPNTLRIINLFLQMAAAIPIPVLKLLIIAWQGYIVVSLAVAIVTKLNTAWILIQRGAVIANAVAVNAAAIATRIWTAAQWLLNLAMRANPILLIVTLIALFVIAVVRAYQTSATFRAIVSGAWRGVGAVISAVWNGTIRAVLFAFRAVSRGTAFVFRGATFLMRGAWRGMGSAIGVVYRGTIRAVMIAARGLIRGTAAVWRGATSVMRAVWRGMAAAMGAAYRGTMRAVMAAARAFIRGTAAVWRGATSVMRAVWRGAAASMGAVYRGTIRGVMAGARAAVRATASAFRGATAVIRGVWRGMAASIGAVYRGPIHGAFQAIKAALGTVRAAFRAAVSGIRGTWNKLRGIVAGPIRFFVNTVYDHGLRRAWNSTAGKIPGVPDLPSAHVGFASGGKVSGPGGPRSDKIPAWLSSGEYVINAKAVKQIGLSPLNAINRGAVGNMGGMGGKGVEPHMFLGGLIPDFHIPNPFDAIKSALKKIGGFFSHIPGLDKLFSFASFITKDIGKAALDITMKPVLSTLNKIPHGFKKAGMVAELPVKLAVNGIKKMIHFALSKMASLIGFGGGGGAGGAKRWTPVVLQALKLAGESAANLGNVLHAINKESGGNPHAVNRTDSNAKAGHPSGGLLQTIASTFNRYAGPFRGLGMFNPLANIYAAIKYARARYGSGWSARMAAPGGYDNGGFLPPGLSLAYNGTGRPEPVGMPGGVIINGNVYTKSEREFREMVIQSLAEARRRGRV